MIHGLSNAYLTGQSKLTCWVTFPNMEGMTEVQDVLEELKGKGWTLAAISDAVEVHRDSVVGWDTGRHNPANPRLVVRELRQLLRRRSVPKRKRYKKAPNL